jgi:hypothetical protein
MGVLPAITLAPEMHFCRGHAMLGQPTTQPVNTSDLNDFALDYAVALAEGYEVAISASRDIVVRIDGVVCYFAPSKTWSWAGEIIDREDISLSGDWINEEVEPGRWQVRRSSHSAGIEYSAEALTFRFSERGPTKMVAAMRTHVHRKLGRTVEIPVVLLQGT